VLRFGWVGNWTKPEQLVIVLDGISDGSPDAFRLMIWDRLNADCREHRGEVLGGWVLRYFEDVMQMNAIGSMTVLTGGCCPDCVVSEIFLEDSDASLAFDMGPDCCHEGLELSVSSLAPDARRNVVKGGSSLFH
jgi:hypothetical protein